MQLKIPQKGKFGEVRSNGNGEKVFKLNLRSISIIVTLVLIFLGGITAGTAWVIQQTDTTKTVKKMKNQVDVIQATQDTNTAIQFAENSAQFRLLKAIVRSVNPEEADILIGDTEKELEQNRKLHEKQLADKVERIEKKK